MTSNGKPQIRYNAEVKKAILMADEYDAYKTLTQFYRSEKDILEIRRQKALLAVHKFAEQGGSMEFDDTGCSCVVALRDVSYHVTYDEDGGVREYTVKNPSQDENAVLYLHWMFYCATILDRLDAAIDEANVKLANLENDILIRSLSKTAGTIANDVYLTAGAVAGLDLRTEEDIDPFGILGGKAAND